MKPLLKFPRTPHLEGSRLQAGDEDLAQVPLDSLGGKHTAVTEKLDGANCAISFDDDGTLLLQSRGHYLTGGPREKHFDLFKQWARARQPDLRAILGRRYIMYGEWLYALHTIFYDALPHYFLEFDMYDCERASFLDTERRCVLLDGSCVRSVAASGPDQPSHYITPNWREHRPELSDPTGLPEGLYIKWEDDGIVKGRYKFVRASFLDAVAASGGHWLNRPIVPNLLAPGVDIFA